MLLYISYVLCDKVTLTAHLPQCFEFCDRICDCKSVVLGPYFAKQSLSPFVMWVHNFVLMTKYLLPCSVQVDKENAPHVGGNTWAGGTGGRDTAGLGGKGGPYRLDAGHDVYQLSDEEKKSVPEEVCVHISASTFRLSSKNKPEKINDNLCMYWIAL